MDLNCIPIFGWLLDLGLNISLAVPFYIIWTRFGIGEKYFYFLPEIYKNPSFWNIVGVFVVVPIIYSVFVPKFVNISQIHEKK